MKKTRRLQLIFGIYWFMLAYILAALIWWFIALNHQNHEMADLKIHDVISTGAAKVNEISSIEATRNRKVAQYIGEGSIFLLLIAAGAIYIYRAVNRQLKQSIQQQNFMMAITHELKTPIAVAQLNLETLKKRNLNEEQQQRLITTTLQETKRLNALCNNMLLTSQIDAGGYKITKEIIQFDELLERCVEEFCARFPDRKINSQIAENVIIEGDELLLQMAANNLIDNAIKYSPKNSLVNIFLENNTNVQLSVIDEGGGIEDTEKQKVFQKYYRTGNAATQSAKGTGLGLYLIQKVVNAHKGSITLHNNIPNGCRFVLTFPKTV